MPAAITGPACHGEFSSADASALSEANSRILLYAESGTTALTLDANDVVLVTDIRIVTGAAITVSIYDGADNSIGAGELIDKVTINGSAPFLGLHVPHFCQKGTWPKVKTSGAGQVDVQIHGTIVRRGA